MSVALVAMMGSVIAGAAPASAGVAVEVDVGAPFTERDLSEAVALRAPDGADDPDVIVRVAKLGLDQLIVSVGTRSTVVVLPDRDRSSSTRVVALIVTSMLDGEQAETPPPAHVEPAVAAGPAPAARLSLRMGTSLGRDDNGYVIPLVHAGGARVLAPHARLVASAGLGTYDGYLGTRSVLVPLRLGIEGRSGALGVELGGQLLAFRESSCGGGEWGAAQSVYGAGKVYVPVTPRVRLVGELGGHFVVATDRTTCNSATNYTSYGGWFGGGVEW